MQPMLPICRTLNVALRVKFRILLQGHVEYLALLSIYSF
jgi:hypothetical protein